MTALRWAWRWMDRHLTVVVVAVFCMVTFAGIRANTLQDAERRHDDCEQDNRNARRAERQILAAFMTYESDPGRTTLDPTLLDQIAADLAAGFPEQDCP